MTVAIQKMTLEEFLNKIESSILENLDLSVDRVLQGR
jgi:hypothetical protein